MADAEDFSGCLLIVLALAAIALALYIAFLVAQLMFGVGAVYGALVSTRNYFRALVHNLQPERVTS
jgi:disulfide bond formation protein DsbB